MSRQQKKLYQQIIHNRHKAILDLIKTGKDVSKIETETALLVLDTINALQAKAISLKESCKCFIKIDYSLNRGLEDKFSEDFQDLLNEAILLDEVGTTYGPDLNQIIKLATKILNRPNQLSESKIKGLVRA